MTNKETIKARAENFVINMRIFNEFLFELHIHIIKILLLIKIRVPSWWLLQSHLHNAVSGVIKTILIFMTGIWEFIIQWLG